MLVHLRRPFSRRPGLVLGPSPAIFRFKHAKTPTGFTHFSPRTSSELNSREEASTAIHANAPEVPPPPQPQRSPDLVPPTGSTSLKEALEGISDELKIVADKAGAAATPNLPPVATALLETVKTPWTRALHH